MNVDGTNLCWRLISEPLWSSELRYKGLCLSVRAESESQRELIIEYPYPRNSFGSPLPLPQRPSLSAKMVEADVRRALAAGWNPVSRGKAFVYYVPEISIERRPSG